MSIIDGIISGGISNMPDVFGKSAVKSKKTGGAGKALNQAQSLYKPKQLKESAVIQETLDLISEIVFKTAHMKKDKDGLKLIPVIEVLRQDENPEETEKIRESVIKLKEQLETFAQKSEINAALLMRALKSPDFIFCFATDNMTLKALNINPSYLATYLPVPGEGKFFIVSVQDLIDFSNRSKFYDILSHELTHCADDLACDDKVANMVLIEEGKETQIPLKKAAFLSKDKFKKEIQPLLAAEMEKNKKLMESLKEIRIKKLKEKNPDISEVQIKDDIAQRPLFRVDADSAEEFELIKNSTWCWHNFGEGKITAPFVSYLQEGYNLNNLLDSDTLTIEYAAYGVEFFISDDASKKERLQKQAPEFYAFLEKKFIPSITKES